MITYHASCKEYLIINAFFILVPAIIESEIEKTNISTFFEPPQFKNLFDTSDTISPKAYQMCK